MTLKEYIFRRDMARVNNSRPTRRRNRLTYDDRIEAMWKLKEYLRQKKEKQNERNN